MRARVRDVGAVPAGLLLLALAGCQPLNKEGTIAVSAGKGMFLEIEAPRGEQKVQVTVTAPVEVSAYLFVSKNKEAVENATLGKTVKADLLLNSKTNEKEIDFEATVPAKEPFTLYVTTKSLTPVDVKYKIVGR